MKKNRNQLRVGLLAMVCGGVLASLAQAQPFISQQPTNSIVAIGQSTSLSVSATGSGTLAYQWFKDGVRLTSQTNASLGFASFQFTNCGSYSVAVTNDAGLTLSQPAFLSVDGLPLLVTWGLNNYGQLGAGQAVDYSLPIGVATNVVATAGGSYHSLFLGNDARLLAVGRNNFGQLGIGTTNDHYLPVVVASNVMALACGGHHSLFVKSDGVLWAAGFNYFGQLGNGTTTDQTSPVAVASNVVAVAGSGGHSLFLKSDGTLWIVGANVGTNQTIPFTIASNVVSFAGGGGCSLFIKSDGALWAMGDNGFGQLGIGSYTSTNQPVVVASNVIAVTGGDGHSLFVKGDGTLWATGDNYFGQLGDGTVNRTNRPVVVASNVVAIAAGDDTSLFVKGDGTLWNMGRNTDGQLPYVKGAYTNLPAQVPGCIAASLGGRGMIYHSLAVGLLAPQISALANVIVQPAGSQTFSPAVTGTGPFTFQWQLNGTNILGATNSSHTISAATIADNGIYTLNVVGLIGSTSASARLAVRLLPQVEISPAGGLVAAGASASLSVTNTGGLSSFQWFKDGARLAGQTNGNLFIGSFHLTNSGSYNVVVTSAYGTAISRPVYVGVSSGADLLGWGLNGNGQLGTTSVSNLPLVLATNVATAAGGGNHTLFIRSDGTLWSMGQNSSGQLGNGTTISTNRPTFVASNAVAVSAGQWHSLFVTSDGTLWAMGWNANGQLGQEWGNNRSLPVAVADNVTAVAAGSSHSHFITADGSLWAMGVNNTGQLGVGDQVDRFSPVLVASDVVSVAAGGQHSLFVKNNGTLWAMGYNGFGQLGNGTNINQSLPVAVASDVLAAAAGFYHSLFTKSDGSLWAVGHNSYGQLGNGTIANTNLAVFVTNGVATIAAGFYHSVFARADGGLWAMGRNNYGQLGNGTVVNTNRPAQLTGFTVASLGALGTAYHSLATGITTPWISGLTNIRAFKGQAVTLNPVTGGSGPFSYQWKFNGADIAGATNSSYSIASVAPINAGIYTLVVTGAAGSSSASATISIMGFITWTVSQGGSGPQLDLQFTGSPGDRIYTLQATTNLSPPATWQSVASRTPDQQGRCFFTVTNLAGSQRFFRVLGLWP